MKEPTKEMVEAGTSRLIKHLLDDFGPLAANMDARSVASCVLRDGLAASLPMPTRDQLRMWTDIIEKHLCTQHDEGCGHYNVDSMGDNGDCDCGLSAAQALLEEGLEIALFPEPIKVLTPGTDQVG